MKIVADDHIPYLHDYFPEAVRVSGRHIAPCDVADADVLLVRSITHVNETLLKNSTVRFVGSVTAGADHVDTDYLKAAGIAFARADGFNAPPVADYVVSVVAALQNRGHLLNAGKKAAVIGVGHVGRLVAAHLNTLGFEVTLCDPLRAAAEPSFHSTPLAAIRGMDLVTLHVPLTKTGEHATHHFLKPDFFERQQPDCVLINASRGGVIDTDVLLRLPNRMPLCLDVFEHEPKIDPRLLAKATIATPHIAGYSVQSKQRGIAMINEAMVKAGLGLPRSAPLTLSTQTLTLSEPITSWREVVLSVFDPIAMTQQLREGVPFDACRNQFVSRQEFAYTVLPAQVTDHHLLARLGFQI